MSVIANMLDAHAPDAGERDAGTVWIGGEPYASTEVREFAERLRVLADHAEAAAMAKPPTIVASVVEDDGETWDAMRCPDELCGLIVSEDEGLAYVVDGEIVAWSERIDTDAQAVHMGGDVPPGGSWRCGVCDRAVSIPEGWTVER